MLRLLSKGVSSLFLLHLSCIQLKVSVLKIYAAYTRYRERVCAMDLACDKWVYQVLCPEKCCFAVLFLEEKWTLKVKLS